MDLNHHLNRRVRMDLAHRKVLMDDYIIEKKRKREREEEEELYARMKKNLREFEANEQLKIKERMRRYFELQANQKIDYEKIKPRSPPKVVHVCSILNVSHLS